MSTVDSLTGHTSKPAETSSQSSAQASSVGTEEKQTVTAHPSEERLRPQLEISEKSAVATKEENEHDGGQDVDNAEYPKGIHLFTIILGLVMAMMLAVMDMTILATAIPHITDQFHSLDDVGWYASVYFVTVASSQSAWGKAYKYFDLKTVFLLTIFLFEIGSLICGVANSSITLIVGRAITGYGAAGVLAGCYTIVAFAVRPEKRPAFAGVLAATYGVASSIAPVLGGALADRVSWRWCFYINLPIGGLSAVIIFFTFKTPAMSRSEKDAKEPLLEKCRQMDLIGTFIITAAVVCLLLALQWGGVSKKWSSADVIGTLVGFCLFTIIFIGVEYGQGDRALLVPHILKQRVVYMGCIVSFFLGGAEFSLIYYIPIYFQSILGSTAEDSGVRNLAFIIPVTLFTMVSGAAITTVGYYTPFVLIGGIMTTIGSGLMYTWSQTSPASLWIGAQVLAGIGIGLCFQAPIMAGQALARPEDVSATTAMLLFFQTMGGAFMVSAAQSGFTNTLLKRLAVYAPSVEPEEVLTAGARGVWRAFEGQELVGVMDSYMEGLNVAFVIIVVLAACATVLSLGMPWTSIKKKKEVAEETE